MEFQQIRNATIKLAYSNVNILVDPWFAKKDSIRTIQSPDENKNKILNPTVELPLPIEDIVEGINVCIITHNHLDHFDIDSISYIDKNVIIFVQNREDYQMISDLGFKFVNLLKEEGTLIRDIMIYKTKCQHGEYPNNTAGEASGVVLTSATEKTVYICGDTVWYDEIETTIKERQPEVIILNACDARLKDIGRLIMNLDDIKKVRENSAADSRIIISHMESVNHAYINRGDVKKFIRDNNLTNICVPDDGEIYII